MYRAAEILDGIDDRQLNQDSNYTQNADNAASIATYSTEYESSLPALTEKEYNKYQYAKALFQMRQYDNVAFILSNYTHPKLVFLKLYAKYLVRTDANIEIASVEF